MAHPAHAEPVNYPYVVGFERFHSSLDDDDYLAQGGMILLNELNCVACHEPPAKLKDQLQGVEATNLAGVASRLGDIDLEIMIRNPRFVKRDTIMPSLFAGPDRDLDEVTALKHYLASLEERIPSYPVGDIDRGRAFYHRVGCVACHAPEVGYRPPGIPENAEIELAGLPSVPMNLADLYSLDALTHFLLSPNQHRPSGRMPAFHLSITEAADLAAYLKAGPDLVLPENITQALTNSEPFVLDPEFAARGKALFVSKSCTACHTVPGGKESLDSNGAAPLLSLGTGGDTGCLSSRPPGGRIPFYGLDEVQKRAITAALVRLADHEPLSGSEEIDWRMKSLNCYACHERDGVGGPETAREVYFGFEVPEAVDLGRWGNLPPALDEVGSRLNPEALKEMLLGEFRHEKVRPSLTTRMPQFSSARVEPLLQSFRQADPEGFDPPEGISSTWEGAAEWLNSSGSDCRRCHGVGDTPPTELPGINLRDSASRLQYPYFRSLLLDPQSVLPGLPKEAAFPEDPQEEEKIRALWNYLRGEP